MTSKVNYTGDLRSNMIHLQSGSVVITDAPTDNHGKGEAFSPTDLMATALASCMLTTMAIAIRTREDYPAIDGASAEVTKVMSTEPPRRIVKIVVNVTMPKNNYTDEQKRFLEKVAHNCPISKSVHPDLEQVLTFNW